MQVWTVSWCRGISRQTAFRAACNFSWGQEGCVLKFPISPASSLAALALCKQLLVGQRVSNSSLLCKQSGGTAHHPEIWVNLFYSLFYGQAASSACAEEKAPSQPWARRRNHSGWAFSQRLHTSCSGRLRSHVGVWPDLIFRLNWDSEIHFPIFLKLSSCTASKSQVTSFPILLSFTPAFLTCEIAKY